MTRQCSDSLGRLVHDWPGAARWDHGASRPFDLTKAGDVEFTWQEQLPCRRLGDAPAGRPCHIEARASSPARDAERRRRHVGACRHVVSSAVDRASYVRDRSVVHFEIQAGGRLRVDSEYSVAFVPRAESRLARRRLESGCTGRGCDHAKGGTPPRADGGLAVAARSAGRSISPPPPRPEQPAGIPTRADASASSRRHQRRPSMLEP